MKTGIVSESIICLPLLYYLQSQQECFTVFTGRQVMQNGKAIDSFCAGAGISCTHENSSGQSIYDWVANQQPDIVFVIGYNRLIKMNRFTYGIPALFNVHFGHLPQFRGPNPVFWQLKKGVPALAISIHCMNEQFDAGAVVWKKEYPNQPFFSYGYVHQLMSHYLIEGVNALLQLKKQGQAIHGIAQDERSAGYYGRPGRPDTCINWRTMPAAEISDLIKACNPWNGGSITTYNGFEIKISDAEAVAQLQNAAHLPNQHLPPGTILDTTNRLLVLCINNEMLNIHTLTVGGILMPGRFAANYGFTKGYSFQSI